MKLFMSILGGNGELWYVNRIRELRASRKQEDMHLENLLKCKEEH